MKKIVRKGMIMNLPFFFLISFRRYVFFDALKIEENGFKRFLKDLKKIFQGKKVYAIFVKTVNFNRRCSDSTQ